MIQNNEIQTNNIFSSFPQYNLKRAETVSQNNKNTDDLTDKTEFTTEKKSKNKKKIFFGSTIASTVLTAGLIGMCFAKGFHGSAYNKLSKITEKLTNEIQETSLESTKDLANKTVYYAKKGTKKTIEGLKSASNFTAIKDWFCDKMFRTNKATAKFADNSKKGFKKIVDKTLGKKYNKVEIKVKDLTSLLKHYNLTNLSALDETQKLQEITIKDTKKTLGEWLEILSLQTNNLETAYDKGFSLGARKIRDTKRTNLLSGISDKIQNRFFKNKGLFKPKNYKNYVTEDVTKTAKNELKKDILQAKKEVTNNIPSIHDGIKDNIKQLSDIVIPTDKESTEAIQLLRQKLESFRSCSGTNEAAARKKISEDISSIINKSIGSIKNNENYSQSQKKAITKQLEKIKTSITSTNGNSKGALEEIMTILKGLNSQKLESTGEKIISDADYKEFSKLSSKISNGLNRAADLEIDEYFIKQAELEVGSAPTDILSLLFPIGAGTFAIAKGDDKDEKISATLTTCVPLVGTFATFIYGTAKMFTGPKNLLLSFTSGILLSKLGNYCDKLYKKYKASGSVTEVAKEEYNNFWTEITPQYAQPLNPSQK